MPDKTTIMKEAQKYLARGQIDRAIAEWEKLVNEAPEANTFNTIGDLYLRKGDKQSAVENFHGAARLFRTEGFSLKALALYKKIINIKPQDADSLIALGELSEEKGLVTDAIKYYLSAADILSKEAKKDAFLSIYEKILSLAPLNIPLREKVAGLFLKEGLTADAVREYVYIAKFYGERGEPTLAGEYYNKALSVKSDNREALLGLSALCETSDLPKAIAYAKKALSAHPDDQESLLKCVALMKEGGMYDEAVQYLSKAIGTRPFDPDLHRLLGDIHVEKGEREKAWESYKTVIDSFATEGRIDEAIDLAREFRDIDPVDIGKLLISLHRQHNDAEAVFDELISVADLLSEQGMEDEALAYYREALKIRPDDLRLKRRLAEREIGKGGEFTVAEGEKTTEDLLDEADIFIKYGLYDEAKPILEDLKMQDPGSIEVHRRLKSVYLDVDDREQAVTECLILSELYRRAADMKNSELVFKEALEINPDDPRLAERLSEKAAPAETEIETPALEDYSEDVAEAEFYLRQGLAQDALRIYERLLDLFPDNEEFQGKVQALRGDVRETTLSEEAAPQPEEQFEFEEITLGEKETLEVPEVTEPHLESDVLDIFEEFKKGLEEQLEEEDYETHYNLGIAYKEMGLIDDAIKEFQTSRKDDRCAVRSMSMLGICYMEKGLYPLAIDAFKSAVAGIAARDESYWGARYDLAAAYEKNGNLQEAYDIFSEIYGKDSTFREVSEKVNALRAAVAKNGTSKTTPKKDRVSYL